MKPENIILLAIVGAVLWYQLRKDQPPVGIYDVSPISGGRLGQWRGGGTPMPWELPGYHG